MDILLRIRGWGIRYATFLVLSVGLIACATGPKIDWNSRVGNYTYDQAVVELGPPDKMATLTNGTKVAEWLTSRGYSQGYVSTVGPGMYSPNFYGPTAGYFYSEPPAPDHFLRLTFAPDGRLQDWRRVIR